VLRGHIGISSVIFPKEITTGKELDFIARMSLWEQGLEYAHGTGHGVGAFLAVHEGPQRITWRSAGPAFGKGMTISNEPGYYETGHFGIRIENVMVVVETTTKYNADGFLAFEQLTMVPYDRNLIDLNVLSDKDIQYVNDYHKKCLEKLTPFLADDAFTLKWLQKAAQPIHKH